MTKLTLVVILVSCILSGRVSRAQTYSLEESISIALANNQRLKNYQLDVQSAEFRIKEAKSALLPTVDLTGQFQYYRDVPYQYVPTSAFGGPEGEYTKMSLSMKQTTSAGLQVSQSLFNQAAITGVKAAKVSQEVLTLQEEVFREELIYDVTATYYTIQVLSDNLKRLRENINNFEKTVQVNGVLKDNDVVSANVHNRILVNLENLQNQYENQRLLLDKNMSQLKYLLNIPVDEQFQVNEFDYAEQGAVSPPAGISRRPDVMLQQVQVKLSELDKKTVVAGYFPTLTQKFSFGYAGYYNEFAPAKQINDDWIKSSYFSVTLKIPVFDGFQKQNQIRQKDINIQKNINTLSMLKANADREVEDAMKDYITNKSLLQSNKKSLDLAERLFISSQGEYESGITSVTEFLNAQNDLSNARVNYSSALLNLKLSELSLKKANGTLITNP